MIKGMIQEAGRKDTIGRPILYATTDLFLSHFGISSLDDLPPLPEKESNSPEEESEFAGDLVP
jgi:segregation and condensation protein B